MLHPPGRLSLLLGCILSALAGEETWRGLVIKANATHETGDLTAAEAVYLRALEKAHAQGEFSLPVAVVLNNLGRLHLERGAYATALQMLGESFAILEKQPEETRPELAKCLHNLAVTYTSQARFAEAEAAFLRALQVWRETPRPDVLTVATTELAFGDLFLQTGEYEKAEEHLSRALAIRKRALGEHGPSAAVVTGKLAELYRMRGQYARAEAALRKALARAVEPGASAGSQEEPVSRLPKQLGLVLAVLETQLGFVLYDRRKLTQAEAAWRRGLALIEEHLGANHPETGVALLNLAQAAHLEDRHAEAENLFRRILTIFETTYGAGHLRTAGVIHRLGTSCAAQGRVDEAAALYENALASFEARPAGADLGMAGVLRSIAQLHRDQGRKVEAAAWFRRALKKAEHGMGPEHPALAAYLAEYAAALKDSGRKKEAEAFRTRAERLRDANHARHTVDILELSRGR